MLTDVPGNLKTMYLLVVFFRKMVSFYSIEGVKGFGFLKI